MLLRDRMIDIPQGGQRVLRMGMEYSYVQEWIHRVKGACKLPTPHKLRVEDGRLIREPGYAVLDSLGALALQDAPEEDCIIDYTT